MNLRIKKLRESRGTMLADLEGMLEKAGNENRALNDDERKAYDDLKANFARVDRELEEATELERLQAMNARPLGPDGNSQHVPLVRARYGRLKNFVGEGAEERAYRAGMWLRAAIFSDQAAKTWCQEAGVPLIWQKAAQNEGNNAQGGFLVPDEFMNAIIDLRETYGIARRELQLVPMGSDTLYQPRRTGGVTAYFVGENTAITESQATWDNVGLVAKKLAAYVLMSSEVAEDAVISLADWLSGEIAYAFAEKEDDCLFNGDGTSTYGGITGARVALIDGTHTAGAIDAAANNDTYAEFTAADIAKAMSAAPQYAIERGAKFYCSQTCWSGTFQRLIAAAGGATIDALTGAMIRPAYLGHPVVISQKFPTGVADDLSNVAAFLFGNLGLAAMMGERRGITLATSEHIKFAEDQIAIRGTERFHINVHSLGDTSTAGPIVGLIGE